MKKQTKHTVAFRAPAELWNRIKRIAAKDGIMPSQLLRKVITRYVASRERTR